MSETVLCWTVSRGRRVKVTQAKVIGPRSAAKANWLPKGRAMTSSCLTPTACWMLRGCGLAATVGAEPSLVDTRPAACYPAADWLLSLLSGRGLAVQHVIRPRIGYSACYPAGDWLFSLLSGRGLAAGAATEPSLVAARRPWQIKTARVCLVVPCAALT